MKVLLIQFGLNPISLPAVCGNSGKVYGHARHNQKLGRHEFEMPLEQYQDPVVFRDLFNALRRPGCQWMPLFPVDANASKVDTDALKAEVATLKSQNATLVAEIEALKSELIGDEAEAVGGDLQESKQPIPLEKRGLNFLRKTARKLGHRLAGNPSKEALITFITEKQAEPAAV